jgi:hypothetical protein
MDDSRQAIKPVSGTVRVEHYAWSIGKLDRLAMAADYFVALFS